MGRPSPLSPGAQCLPPGNCHGGSQAKGCSESTLQDLPCGSAQALAMASVTGKPSGVVRGTGLAQWLRVPPPPVPVLRARQALQPSGGLPPKA